MSENGSRLVAIALMALAGGLTLGLSSIGYAVGRPHNTDVAVAGTYFGGGAFLVAGFLFLRNYQRSFQDKHDTREKP